MTHIDGRTHHEHCEHAECVAERVRAAEERVIGAAVEWDRQSEHSLRYELAARSDLQRAVAALLALRGGGKEGE